MNAPDAIFHWVLAASLRASLVAALIIVLRFALRRHLPPGLRHALWWPVLLVLVLPALPVLPRKAATDAGPAVVFAEAASAEESGGDSTAVSSGDSALSPEWRSLLPWMWLAGAGIVLVWGGTGHVLNMRRIRRGARPADAGLVGLTERLAREAGLRKAPTLCVSDAVEGPAVTGLTRPVLLLPADLHERLEPEELRFVLLHELTHLKRRDVAVHWLMALLQALHWFNPVLWLAFLLMRRDRETACDARVLAKEPDHHRAGYGHALLKVASFARPSPLLPGFVGLFDGAAPLRSRIRDIAGHRPAGAGWRVMVGCVAVFLLAVGGTRAKDAEAPQPPVPAPMAADLPGEHAIAKKMKRIIIPVIDFEDMPLEEVVDFLRLRSVELDKEAPEDNRGVNFVIRHLRHVDGEKQPLPHVTLKVRNVSVFAAVSLITQQIGYRCVVDQFAATLLPQGDDAPPPVKIVPPPPPEPQGPAVDRARKLILPVVNFEDVSLQEAMDFIQLRSAEFDPGKKGLKIELAPHADPKARIRELRLRNVPVDMVLRYCCEQTRHRWSDDNGVIRISR